MIKCHCGGEVDFSFADILFTNQDKSECGIEGLCRNCYSTVFVKYKATNIEITNLEQDNTKFYPFGQGIPVQV